MKKRCLLLGVLAILFVFGFKINQTKSYTTDISKSKIDWFGYKKTGKHNGTVNLKSGNLILQDGQLVGGEFNVEMNTIVVLDSDSKKLLNHLKSDDFFDVEKFPTALFVIHSSVKENDSIFIVGDMTIKDITKQISFKAKLNTDSKNIVSLNTDVIKIQRDSFDIKYRSTSFFGRMKNNYIKDAFEIQVQITATIE